MAFAVEDFQGLMALLRTHPEWLAELRHLLIDEFWQPLREDVQRLAELVEAGRVESDRRWEENDRRWEESGRRFDQVAEQLGLQAHLIEQQEKQALAQALILEEHTKILRTHTDLLADHSTVLHRLETRVGRLDGMALESHVRDKAPGIFGRTLRRARVVLPGNLEPVLEAADRNLLSDAEWEQLMRLDMLLSGRRDCAEVLLAIEVSSAIDGSDVGRAIERAALLRRCGYETMAAVAGNTITDFARERAASHDVLVQLVA